MPNWLKYLGYTSHLWISEMKNAVFNGFLHLLTADCLPPSLKLDQAEGEFPIQWHLAIWGDANHLSLILLIQMFRISHAPEHGLCLWIGLAVLNFQSLACGQVCYPVILVFCGRFCYGMFFGGEAPGTGSLSPDILQLLSFRISQ